MGEAVVERVRRRAVQSLGVVRLNFEQRGLIEGLLDKLTRGERTLVSTGETNAVLHLRRLWQSAMRDSCSRKIEELTERRVIGFMSDNHIDPDIAVEVFILEPLSEDPVV